MPKVIFVALDGERYEIDTPSGTSAMMAARLNDIPGIDAECGGAMACATCHVYVDEDDLSKLAAPSDIESQMLECVAAERRKNSRLSCQIVLTDELDGLTLRIPETQS